MNQTHFWQVAQDHGDEIDSTIISKTMNYHLTQEYIEKLHVQLSPRCLRESTVLIRIRLYTLATYFRLQHFLQTN